MDKNIIIRSLLPINSDLQKLISQIESDCGEEVVFRRDIAENHEGASDIINGIPTVFLSPAGMCPITICHELLHIKCKIQNFPRPKTIHASGEFTKSIIKNTTLEIAAMIEHKKIYPEMLAFGFDPYKELENKTWQDLIPNIKVHNPKNPHEIVNERIIGHHLLYFRNIMRPLSELDSPELHKEIKKNAKIKCPLALAKAEKIASLIKSHKKWDQKTYTKVLAESINIAGIPKGTYSI